MSDKPMILETAKKQFKTWYKTLYHNKTIHGEQLAWSAWRSAIIQDRKEMLANLEPEDYQAVLTKRWMRKEVSALGDSSI